MASERNWAAIAARPFTLDGGTSPANAGQVTLANTIDFRVKQQVIITATGQPSLEVEVKAVQSDTILFVGPPGNINFRSDLTLYTVASGAMIFANPQPRPGIPEKEFNRAEFEEEPVVAKRVYMVDDFGDAYNSQNPMPISFDGAISIGEVSIVGNANPLYDQAPGMVTSAAFQTVYSYTSTTDNTRIEALEITVSTPALIQIVLNGITIRQKRSSPMKRSILIQFKEPRKVPNGQNLQVQVLVDRFIATSYDTFVSLEGFLEV